MRPLGIPPEASVRPTPTPRSPLTITAAALRFVGAGGLAKVFGANVLVGKSRMLGIGADDFLDVGVSGGGGVGSAPGPTGMDV